jgi:hypothetical protein
MMKDEINQNKDVLRRKDAKSKEKAAKVTAELPETAVEKGSAKEEIENFSFPTSLNEDLEQLLSKNPRRFFGGCGG